MLTKGTVARGLLPFRETKGQRRVPAAPVLALGECCWAATGLHFQSMLGNGYISNSQG